jgi:hypothetical protein
MSDHDHPHPHCCPCGNEGVSRRDFLKTGGLAVTAAAMAGLAWSELRAADAAAMPAAPARRPLVVKPVLVHDLPQRREKTSWRSWGGVHTPEAAAEETARITAELEKLRDSADFPVQFLPVSAVRAPKDVEAVADIAQADAIIIYAAGGWNQILDALVKTGKHVIFFVRHRSGPVYLWYEIISPRYLRQHSDKLAVPGLDYSDVIVDSQDEILWRLRSLCGLKNALGMKILAVGGPAGWECPKAPDLSRAKWKLDIQTVDYKDLGPLIQAARADAAAVESARTRAAAYLADGGVKLETEKIYVENCFLLEQVFRGLMARAGCGAITINSCMGTIMPMAETTACLTLSLLNDAGYLAFCESDFVVIPSGILLASISGRPVFLNDPTYPHDGLITLAHCTAPRRNDGKTLDPARLVTHFESDYGAAPKVEMPKGTLVTNIIPDFLMERWTGFLGTIVEAPFLPICRSQIEVAYTCSDKKVAENMPGFHWMTCYGDYRREIGYALRKVPIAWEDLG